MTKITIIGGGSYSWSPTFMRDIFISPKLKGSTLCLEDIDADRVALTHSLGEKMIRDFNLEFHLEKTLNLDHALDGADFVILTITTGGFETMRPDLDIPANYGIQHTVGDTVGPAGLSRALRNIPVVAEIASKVDEICPNAFFLNYSNPLSVLTQTIDSFRSVPHRTVGLCHEWHGVRRKLAELFKADPHQVVSTIAGINHLPWALDLHVDGKDVWDDLPSLKEKILAGQVIVDEEDTSPFADHFHAKMKLFEIYGILPVAGDRHIAEFFSHFVTPETNWGGKFGIIQTTVDYREGLQSFEHSLIQSTLSGETPLEPFMQELSSESASEIITALTTGENFIGIMNLPNEGQITNVPIGPVVETNGVLDANGFHAISAGSLPAGIQAVVEQHLHNQELTLEAALTGSRELCLQVLMNDPFARGLGPEKIKNMLEDLLLVNRRWLPQFWN